jgi:hypothetical protein
VEVTRERVLTGRLADLVDCGLSVTVIVGLRNWSVLHC